jgi:hypothetical protein
MVHAADGPNPMDIGGFPASQLHQQIISKDKPGRAIPTLGLMLPPLPKFSQNGQPPTGQRRLARQPPPSFLLHLFKDLGLPELHFFLEPFEPIQLAKSLLKHRPKLS